MNSKFNISAVNFEPRLPGSRLPCLLPQR